MSEISAKIKKARERRNAAPKPKSKSESKPIVQTEALSNDNSNGFPIGLLASLFLFIFFGAKYGTKRQ